MLHAFEFDGSYITRFEVVAAAAEELKVDVAPPETVSPPTCVLLPIVVEAYEVRPPVNDTKVDVAADGKGYAKLA